MPSLKARKRPGVEEAGAAIVRVAMILKVEALFGCDEVKNGL